MWWSSGCGTVELNITKQDSQIGYHSGSCDHDIAELRKKPAIKRQLNKLDRLTVAMILKEYGAWSNTELLDHDQNLSRLLWMACADIVERM